MREAVSARDGSLKKKGKVFIMRIAIGCDEAAYALKVEIMKHLDKKADVEYVDFGAAQGEIVLYPDVAYKVADAVAAGDFERGILVCGTGIGISIAANKVKGIRAAVVTNEFMAEMCKAHNDANIISFGGRVITIEEAIRFTDIWLDTETEMGRHAERRAMIEA